MSNQTGTVPVVSIVGKAHSGKTVFLEKLVAELTRRGVRVATVKHHIHDYETDVRGKDSWRHAQAGSMLAMVSSPEKLSLVQKVDREMTLPELAMIAHNAGSDVLLSEGYKRVGVNRVEILRRGASEELLDSAEERIALVTDMPECAPDGTPAFGLEDAAGVADLIESRFLSTTDGE